MHHWYYDHPASPGDLARLSSEARSHRAAWRVSLCGTDGRRPFGADRRAHSAADLGPVAAIRLLFTGVRHRFDRSRPANAAW